MRKSLIRRFCLFASILFFLLTFISCSTPKKIKYFQDIPDSGILKTIPKTEYLEPVIRVDDILTVLIATVDPQASAIINAGNIPTAATGSAVGSSSTLQQGVAGYLVDKEGNIAVPILGKIKVLGFTTSQAKDTIEKIASKYFKDASIIVRYANFKISITGEVAKPGVYVVPNEKVSLLDALTMAGDLTIYAKRDNILLIRENLDGTRTPYRIDMTKSILINSPYFYLRQNDYIYVEPSKAKIAANDLAQTRNITIISAILSLLIVLSTRIK